MNVHKNARMTVVESFWWRGCAGAGGGSRMPALAVGGVSERTAYKWLARHRAGGARALHDRSPAPVRLPRRLPAAVVAAIERLRRQRLSGPQIARQLGRLVSTAGLVLRRLGLGRLAALGSDRP